jgi:hypothetical protein
MRVVLILALVIIGRMGMSHGCCNRSSATTALTEEKSGCCADAKESSKKPNSDSHECGPLCSDSCCAVFVEVPTICDFSPAIVSYFIANEDTPLALHPYVFGLIKPPIA